MADMIVCCRVSEANWSVAGAVTAKCKLCDADIWCAPASLEASHKIGLQLTCRECVLQIQREGEVLEFGGVVTPGGALPWVKN